MVPYREDKDLKDQISTTCAEQESYGLGSGGKEGGDQQAGERRVDMINT